MGLARNMHFVIAVFCPFARTSLNSQLVKCGPPGGAFLLRYLVAFYFLSVPSIGADSQPLDLSKNSSTHQFLPTPPIEVAPLHPAFPSTSAATTTGPRILGAIHQIPVPAQHPPLPPLIPLPNFDQLQLDMQNKPPVKLARRGRPPKNRDGLSNPLARERKPSSGKYQNYLY